MTETLFSECRHCGKNFPVSSPCYAKGAPRERKHCSYACTNAYRGRPEVVAAAFWSRVDKRGEAECWPYTGSITSHGYGCTSFHGRVLGAHKVAYLLAKGPVADGLCVMHSCDNPPCCNPAHLSLGTKDDNAKDAVSKGRNVGGWYLRKLKAEDVAEIRSLKGVVQSGELARRFGVEQPHIINIWNRKVWRSV